MKMNCVPLTIVKVNKTRCLLKIKRTGLNLTLQIKIETSAYLQWVQV